MKLSLKEIFNLDFDSRKKYRFDVTKMPGLSLKIEDTSFKISDMSLSGLSFTNNETEILLGHDFECFLNMNGDKIRIVLKLIGKNDGRHGCEIAQNINQYEMFFKKHFSQLTPQQY